MNSASLLRASGLFAATALLFIACGGKIEADYSDAGVDGGKCGNGRIDPGEECDGTRLGGATCSSATMNAHPSGQLSCKQCQLVTTGCTGGSGNNGTGGGNGTGGRGTGGGNGTGGRPGTGGGVGTGGRVGGSGGMTSTTSCTSAADCSGRQVCCGVRTGGQYVFSCAATCARTDTTTECHTNSECGRREICCGTTNQTGTTYTSIACTATCTGNGERPMCKTNADCPNGMTCQTSRVLPNDFKVCR